MRAEIIAGEVVLSPRPLARGGRAQASLGSYVGRPFDFDPDGPGGWWIVIEPEIELEAHEVFIPDLVGWRRTTLPSLPRNRPIRVTPDWVCEILSPSTERYDRVHKADVYLRCGVPHYWMLDVENEVLEAYEASGSRWSRLGAWTSGDNPRIPPFEAIELPVGALFAP
jgi:Uma2 family endonuclease